MLHYENNKVHYKPNTVNERLRLCLAEKKIFRTVSLFPVLRKRKKKNIWTWKMLEKNLLKAEIATTSPFRRPSWSRPRARLRTLSTNCWPVFWRAPLMVTRVLHFWVAKRLKHWQIWACDKIPISTENSLSAEIEWSVFESWLINKENVESAAYLIKLEKVNGSCLWCFGIWRTHFIGVNDCPVSIQKSFFHLYKIIFTVKLLNYNKNNFIV